MERRINVDRWKEGRRWVEPYVVLCQALSKRGCRTLSGQAKSISRHQAITLQGGIEILQVLKCTVLTARERPTRISRLDGVHLT